MKPGAPLPARSVAPTVTHAAVTHAAVTHAAVTDAVTHADVTDTVAQGGDAVTRVTDAIPARRTAGCRQRRTTIVISWRP